MEEAVATNHKPKYKPLAAGNWELRGSVVIKCNMPPVHGCGHQDAGEHPTAPAQHDARGSFRLRMASNEVHCIVNCKNFVGFRVRDLDRKLFFNGHHQLNNIQAVKA